ncbi:DUF664 domain-containing protein [Streptomyces sp. NPDC092952]|uniref:mycothiol transferase n=1 Tax=Streptomyces sp. NPDC092952 TaxID=3366018 RepID=UPI003818318D
MASPCTGNQTDPVSFSGAFFHDFLHGLHARVDRGVSPRRTLVHLSEEYARHNGHSGLVRERIGGAAGG